MLYEEESVRAIAALRAETIKLLGGAPTGIGFIGSPEWVLAGNVAWSLLEAALSSAAREQGAALYRTAQEKTHQLIASGRFFAWSDIAHHELPSPQAWRATLTTVSMKTRDISPRLPAIARRFGIKPEEEIERFEEKLERHFVHDGDEFVKVRTNLGSISIRWTHVVAYLPAAGR